MLACSWTILDVFPGKHLEGRDSHSSSRSFAEHWLHEVGARYIWDSLHSCRQERILLIPKHQPTQQDAGGISRDLMTEFHINLNQKIRHTLFFLRPSFQLRDSTWHSQFKTGWLWRQEDSSLITSGSSSN